MSASIILRTTYDWFHSRLPRKRMSIIIFFCFLFLSHSLSSFFLAVSLGQSWISTVMNTITNIAHYANPTESTQRERDEREDVTTLTTKCFSLSLCSYLFHISWPVGRWWGKEEEVMKKMQDIFHIPFECSMIWLVVFRQHTDLLTVTPLKAISSVITSNVIDAVRVKGSFAFLAAHSSYPTQSDHNSQVITNSCDVYISTHSMAQLISSVCYHVKYCFIMSLSLSLDVHHLFVRFASSLWMFQCPT